MIARLIRRGDGSLGAFTDTGSLLGVVVDESAMRVVDEPTDTPPPWWLRFAWALLVVLLVAFFAFQIGRLYAAAHP